MKQQFPDYPFPVSGLTTEAVEQDPTEELGTFDDILDGARQQGIVTFSPADKFNADNARAHYIRHKTADTRLWLLGYLPEKADKDASADEIYSEAFKNALKQFQQEARITVDGWLGNETWYALESLVNYESDLDVDAWFEGDIPLRPLERAIQLRLFSLGLWKKKPDRTSGQKGLPAKALAGFRDIRIMFSLERGDWPEGPHPKIIKMLFNQDLFVDKLAAAVSGSGDKKAFTYSRDPDTMDKKKTQKLANRFIINVAKIELWLVGFKVDIDGKDDYSISSSNLRKSHKLYGALFLFWRNFLGKSRQVTQRLAQSITPDFFEALQEINRKAGEPKDAGDDYSKEVADHLDDNKKVEEAWGHVRKRSVSLWDGLKRLWRWFKRSIGKIFSFLKKNIFRTFFRYANKAYKIVKTAIDSVGTTIGYFFKQKLPGSSPDQVVILHDTDSDHQVFINRNPDPETIDKMGNRLLLQTAMFKLGCRVLALAVNVFKSIIKGLLGWARLLSALVRSIKVLKPLYNEIKVLRGKVEQVSTG